MAKFQRGLEVILFLWGVMILLGYARRDGRAERV